MQNGIEAYCQTTDRQFRCRIGINAGEPIRDGQDYRNACPTSGACDDGVR